MRNLNLRDVIVRPKSVASVQMEVFDSDGVSSVRLSMKAFYFLALPQDSRRPELARCGSAGRLRRIFVALNEFSYTRRSPRRAPAFSERQDVDLCLIVVDSFMKLLQVELGVLLALVSPVLPRHEADILYTTACQWGSHVGH